MLCKIINRHFLKVLSSIIAKKIVEKIIKKIIVKRIIKRIIVRKIIKRIIVERIKRIVAKKNSLLLLKSINCEDK